MVRVREILPQNSINRWSMFAKQSLIKNCESQLFYFAVLNQYLPYRCSAVQISRVIFFDWPADIAWQVNLNCTIVTDHLSYVCDSNVAVDPWPNLSIHEGKRSFQSFHYYSCVSFLANIRCTSPVIVTAIMKMHVRLLFQARADSWYRKWESTCSFFHLVAIFCSHL